jgi:hypothetical protein
MEYVNVAGTTKVQLGRSRYNVANDLVISNQTLTVGTWYHLAVTISGTTVTAYLNGASLGTTTSSGNGTGASGNETRLGSWIANSDYSSVYMDEVGIWSRALTSAEITQIYNGGTGFTYPFNSGFFSVAN